MDKSYPYMKKLTQTAKTLDEALRVAATHFGVPSGKVQHTVIESGSKGIFGLGTKDVVIEAWVEPTDIVHAFLSDLLARMEFESEVTVRQKDDGILANIESQLTGAIIGRRGETLDALQYITTLYLNKFYSREDYVRVTLDIENYRAKREEALIRLAEGVASKVIRSRRDVVLEPMNPFERRIIHSALQNNRKVTSRSIGEEPNRKIVVTLKV